MLHFYALRKIQTVDQGGRLYRLMLDDYKVQAPVSKFRVRSKDVTLADYRQPMRLQGTEDYKVVSNSMALLRAVPPEYHMKVTGKRKTGSAGPLNATKIVSKQNKKKNDLVKEARDSLADWRNAVYTPLHGDYPSQSECRMKHKAVTDAALRMHAAVKAGVKK